jgi:hypothetical protein
MGFIRLEAIVQRLEFSSMLRDMRALIEAGRIKRRFSKFIMRKNL